MNVHKALLYIAALTWTILCRYYVIAGWIWAIIWYFGLDLIKWALAWVLDEEGTRTGKRGAIDRAAAPKQSEEPQGMNHMGAVSRHNPLGRVSLSQPSPQQLERASMVRVGGAGSRQARTDLQRRSATRV